MLFSRKWLAELVELPADTQDLARRLTAVGLAVEGIEEKDGDVLLDIDVTTNRPDCMNHFGIAREISVIYERPLLEPAMDPAEGAERVEEAADVEVQEEVFCPRYTARVVRGVTVGPSPEWLQERLRVLGLRPINNVVDVTNFVLWELGQPLHAFDLGTLAGRRITVRLAEAGETLVTLDGVARELDPQMLVIADAERPVALAGVMGGLDSEVTGATRDILLESAHFDRKAVRITAKRLGMHTDASHRFERGADPEMCERAAGRAARMIAEIAGGTVLAGSIDRRAPQAQGWPPRGRLELAKLNAFAGAEVAAAEVERLLTGLGFELEAAADGAWEVTVPSWRYFDFQTRPDSLGAIYPADLYEEVLRHFGLDNIPPALPALAGADAPKSEVRVRRDRVRDLLAAAGYTETVHFAFHDPKADGAYPSLRPEARPIPLKNPLSEQYGVLRRSLVPNLVATARFNQRRGAPAVRLFEVATVFYENPAAELPDQPEHLGLVTGGRLGSPWQREVDLDLFDLKGALEMLAEAFGVHLAARPAELPGLLAGNTAELLHGGEVVGFFGRLADEEGYPLYVAELALAALAGGGVSLQVDPPSRFPSIAADYTLTHALSTPWAQIDEAVRASRPADLVAWELKVRYRGPGVPEGAVNTTISFIYNARERSLTQDEVNTRQLGLSGELERRFGWKG